MQRDYVSWTYEHDKVALDGNLSIKDKSMITGRPEGSIKRRIRTLTVKHNVDAEKLDEEEETIIDLNPDLSVERIARYLDIESHHYVRERQRELKERGLIRENKILVGFDKEYLEDSLRKNGIFKTAEENNIPLRLLIAADKLRLFETRENGSLSNKEIKKVTKEAIREEERNRDYGIGKKKLDIEFKKDKDYILKIKETRGNMRTMKGELVQATHNHITFINKNKIRESFLRNDFLMNEIQVREV